MSTLFIAVEEMRKGEQDFGSRYGDVLYGAVEDDEVIIRDTIVEREL